MNRTLYTLYLIPILYFSVSWSLFYWELVLADTKCKANRSEEMLAPMPYLWNPGFQISKRDYPDSSNTYIGNASFYNKKVKAKLKT
jgi:hypothetical protein